jgi:hypothetical protein
MPPKPKKAPVVKRVHYDKEFDAIQDVLDGAAQEAQSHANRIAALEETMSNVKKALGGMGLVVE